jgi:hypothetical protein
VLFFGTAFVRARRRDTDAAAAESELVRGPDGESIPAAIS